MTPSNDTLVDFHKKQWHLLIFFDHSGKRNRTDLDQGYEIVMCSYHLALTYHIPFIIGAIHTKINQGEGVYFVK